MAGEAKAADKPIQRATRSSDPAATTALLAHSLQLRFETHYQELLEQKILNAGSQIHDRKTQLRFRKVLKNLEAWMLLGIIWKESDYVSPDDLAMLGIYKIYHSQLTPYRLAVDIAKEPHDVARLNTKIRTICIAAESYGLIRRIRVTSTMTRLEGTALLDDFMKTLGEQNFRAIQDESNFVTKPPL